MLNKTRRKINAAMQARGLENPEIRWIFEFQLALVLVVALGLLALQAQEVLGFITGALLVTFNFYVLARMVVTLLEKKSTKGIAVLLVGFYLRLILAALFLIACMVWAEFSLPYLIAGLSTVVVSMLVWIGRFYWIHKSKEA